MRITLRNSVLIFLISILWGCGSGEKVAFDVKSITLNYKTKQMEIQGILRNNSNEVIEKVWVWAYFFGPETPQGAWSTELIQLNGSWSDKPIEILQPFKNGNEAEIKAVGNFHWATNESLPKDGYYARVHISHLSKEDAKVASSERSKSTTGAYKVVTIK